jgi:hypothetical protein
VCIIWVPRGWWVLLLVVSPARIGTTSGTCIHVSMHTCVRVYVCPCDAVLVSDWSRGFYVFLRFWFLIGRGVLWFLATLMNGKSACCVRMRAHIEYVECARMSSMPCVGGCLVCRMRMCVDVEYVS